MTPFTKTFQQLFVISFLMINCTTIAMHNSQLQLEDSTKQNNMPTLNNYSLMISAYEKSLMYCSPSVHTDIFNESSLQSTIKNPVILVKIIDNVTPKKSKALLLPVKQLFNCDTKSMIQLYSAYRIKGEPVVINARCVANPKLYNTIDNKITNNTFAQQLNTYANEFYADPMVCPAKKGAIQTFENADILTITTIARPPVTEDIPFAFIEEFEVQTIISHNPKNGCPNKKALMKQMINEEIPQHQNWVTYVKNRELGHLPQKSRLRNKLGKRQ
jgi:hypothetical protein